MKLFRVNGGKLAALVMYLGSLALIAACGSGSSGGGGGASSSSSSQSTDTSTMHAIAAAEHSNPICSRCHTDEGARQYIGTVSGTETYNQIFSLLVGKPTLDAANGIQCKTCHGLNMDTLLGSIPAGLPGTWTTVFKTCTACHQLLKTDGTLNSAYHSSWNAEWAAERVITDSHFDDSATTAIEGYIINPAGTYSAAAGNTNQGSCLDCHNQHNKDLTIHRQWNRSGHGLKTGVAFTKRDFKAASSNKCHRCHTATGFRNLANNPTTYDANRDDVPDTANTFIATGNQKEMIYCWACHYTNTGALRDPGVFNNISPYLTPAARISAIPDVKGSNICLACHSGRESGDGLKSLTGFNNKGFGPVSSHYLAAGGVLYRTIGYEYGALDYSNKSYFAHNTIGVSKAGTGTNGPCVGCHMKTPESHLFSPVTKESGKVVSIVTSFTGNDKNCDICHTTHPMSPAVIEEESEGFQNALEKLKAELAADGFVYSSSYPYFSNTDWTRGTSNDAIGKDNMGAAFNYHVLLHEPGAFAHNRYYTKRLIFDSIDWMDNNVMNGTIDLTGYSLAHEWLGPTKPITAVTRP